MTAPTQAGAARVVVLSVTVPVPDAALSPNSRRHWRTKAMAAKLARRDAGWAVAHEIGQTDERWEPWPAARMDVIWYHAGPPMDDDNAWSRLKPSRDGAVDAGLVADDRDIRIGTLTFRRSARAEQCVIVSFHRIEAA